jgi:TolB-like protein
MRLFNRAIIIFWIVLIPATFSMADEETRKFQVVGEGATYQDALHNALVNGISQQYGFKLKSQAIRQTKVSELSAYVNDQLTSMGNIDISSQGRIDFETEGFVQNYEVLSKSINSSDLFEVDVLITVIKYKTPGISPHSRRKIAIFPFRATSASYFLGDKSIPAPMLLRMFTQKLVTEITQTRRFTVLDREYMEEFLSEKNMILSGDAPVSEQMKIGQILGVDYLLVGTITNIEQTQTPYTIQVTGETGLDYSATFAADYRIIVMATRQIKWSDSVTLYLGHENIEQLVPTLDPDEIQQQMLELGAKQIIHKAMENIYPIRVVEMQHNGDVVLNQGGVTLKQGEIFDVYRLGEKIIDPYTKESLGSSELWVASVEISRVIPKMSYAKIIKGDSTLIQKGQICRRQPDTNGSHLPGTSEKTTDVQSTERGGVVLPFD